MVFFIYLDKKYLYFVYIIYFYYNFCGRVYDNYWDRDYGKKIFRLMILS